MLLQPADDWIFLAVARADGGTLSDVIRAAEYINNTSPFDSEVSGAVDRLSSAGLVRVEGDHYLLTGRGQTLFTAAGGLAAAPRTQFVITKQLLISYVP